MVRWGAAFLTLRRAGWTWPSAFVFADADGHEHSLTKVCSSFVQHFLADEMKATQERSLAKRLAKEGAIAADGGSFPGRISMAAVRGVLTVKECPVDPRGAGALRSVATSAVWTNSRLAAAGYDVDQRCALCRSAPDTLHHRWWECTASQEARDRLTTPETRARARDAGAGTPLFDRAILGHPAERWRGPAADPQLLMQTRGANGSWETRSTEHLGVMRGPG